MMRAQLFDTRVGADKWKAVRWKDERIRREIRKRLQRIEEARQRIAVGFDRPHTDVCADPGQEHVARNADVHRFAKKRGVFRRVPVAGDDPPSISADGYFVASLNAQKGEGQLRNAAPILVAAPLEIRDVLGAAAVGAE